MEFRLGLGEREREREQMKITQLFYISEWTVRLGERRFNACEMTHRSLMQKLTWEFVFVFCFLI